MAGRRDGCCVRRASYRWNSSSTTMPLDQPSPAMWCSERPSTRSEEHTSELKSQSNLVCRLLLEKKKKKTTAPASHDITNDTSSASQLTYRSALPCYFAHVAPRSRQEAPTSIPSAYSKHGDVAD